MSADPTARGHESHPRAAESISVQLTRMEGVLNLVLERTEALTRRMEEVELRTRRLEETTQRLDLESIARDKTAVALALALKEAREAVDATARTKADEANKAWSPFQKFGGALAIVVAIASLYIQVIYNSGR